MRAPISTASAERSLRFGESRVRLARWAAARPVATVFVVAFTARAAAALVVSIFFDSTLVPDDKTYMQIARDVATHQTGAWDDRTSAIYHATGAYSKPLALVFTLLGPRPLAGQLFTAVLGATTAAAVALLLREVVSRSWALGGGLAVALFPSQVLWSSITLKDAGVWAVLASLAVVIAVAGRSSGRQLALLGAAATGLLLSMGYLREHTLVVACWSMVLAVWWAPERGRVLRGIGATAIAVTVPLVLGLGPLGLGFATENVATIDERRADNAAGAASAIPGAAPTTTAAPRQADEEPDDGTPPISYLPRGLVAVALEPFPWAARRTLAISLASAETLVWYPLLALALVGVPTALRRRRAMLFPLVAAGGVLVLYSLTEGNVGTAFRHRGESVWAIAALATVGLCTLATDFTRASPSES